MKNSVKHEVSKTKRKQKGDQKKGSALFSFSQKQKKDWNSNEQR